jgi:transcriptional regulator with XRE-family HTH domain
MGRNHRVVTPSVQRALKTLGEHLRLARLRRRYSAHQVALRAGLSLPTLRAIETGSAQVAMGSYAQVLMVLGLERDLTLVGKDDELGRRLQDEKLEIKERSPKRPLSKK